MTNEPLTAAGLERALAQLGDTTAEADALAEQVRAWFGAEQLRAGPDPKVDELAVAWALVAPGDDVRVRVLADDNSFALPLRRLASSDIFVGATTLLSGTAFRWNYEVGEGAAGRRTLLPAISDEALIRRLRWLWRGWQT